MIWVYILYGNGRMILEQVQADTLAEADKIINTLLDSVLPITKRPDIGAYAAHWYPKQHEEDFLHNICSH